MTNGNDKTQTDPNNDPLGMEEKLRALGYEPSAKPKRGNSAAIGRVIITLAIVIGGFVAYHIYSTNSLQTPLDEAKQTVTKLKAENGQLKVDLAKALAAKLVTDKVVAMAAAPAKPQATITPIAATAPKGTTGILIGTIFLQNQRAASKDETADALVSCSKDNLVLNFCLMETGNKNHTRFETQVLAVTASGMTPDQAKTAKACLYENLLPLKGGQKIVPELVDLSIGKYAGKPCITE